MIPRAESVTNLHLLSIVNTEIKRKTDKKSLIRILDVGCGNGHLINYMFQALALLYPSIEFVVYPPRILSRIP